MSRFVLVAMLAAVMCGCGRDTAEATKTSPEAVQKQNGEVMFPPGSAQLSQITVAEVQMSEVPSEVVTAPGKIEADPNHVARVLLPLPGRIASVLVQLGDSVRRGQPVAVLESPDADVAMSAYLGAKAGLNNAKSGQLKAQADCDRAKDLYQHQAIAQKEVLNAEAALAQAKAAVEQADASREQAQRRLELLGMKTDVFGQKITVNAPISGKVLEINVAPGEYRNDMNAPLMTISDLSTVWVTSDVPETKIRFIDPGEHLDIKLAAFPGQTFRARVTRIADTVDPQTHTVKVRAELENPHGMFRPEMFGEIRHVESMEKRPVVPSAAVIQSEGQNIVYREKSHGHFVPVRVQVGNVVDGHVAITEGLAPGDRIVVDGVMLLKNS